MKLPQLRAATLLFSFLLLPGLGFASRTAAQSTVQDLPPCPPPNAREYILLITNQTEGDRARLEQVLPTGATVLSCRYLEQSVVRVGSFEDEALATSWAEYLTTIEGFPTTVARSPDSAQSQPNQPTAQPVSRTDADSGPTYAPTPLGAGYAVLVRYFDRPSVAAQLQAALNAPVGLAVYEQQSYLLASYGSDPAAAAAVLRGLSDRQFSTIMVDSRQVVRLSQTIEVPSP